jgi:hypothetical protein
MKDNIQDKGNDCMNGGYAIWFEKCTKYLHEVDE